MSRHANAALTPRGRKLLSERVTTQGWTVVRAAEAAGVSVPTATKWVRRYKEGGTSALDDHSSRPHNIHRKNMAVGAELQSLVLALLHMPPCQHGLNRTTWRLVDIKERLCAQGTVTSILNISTVIRQAGYQYKQARVVLTSQDPEYQEKVNAISASLAALDDRDAFFSIDEFGPFSVKMRGGRSLQAPGQIRVVPQWQRSKGSLIVSAALELRSNQLTFFFSEKKNSEETIALVETLRRQYRGYQRVYLSWDAAPWHDSKRLHQKIQFLNEWAEHDNAPTINLRPLPSGSQFLNVIESVFSGMARAVIHNSDYQSTDDAKNAISKYFEERNKAFGIAPRRAGNAIWRQERTPSLFDPANACKDPRYR